MRAMRPTRSGGSPWFKSGCADLDAGSGGGAGCARAASGNTESHNRALRATVAVRRKSCGLLRIIRSDRSMVSWLFHHTMAEQSPYCGGRSIIFGAWTRSKDVQKNTGLTHRRRHVAANGAHMDGCVKEAKSHGKPVSPAFSAAAGRVGP